MAAIVLAVVFSIAIAAHYEYIYRYYENSDLAGYENTIMHSWAVGNTDIIWTADGTIYSRHETLGRAR